MPKVKITIIGNSVALRVRPPVSHPDNKNYTQFLEELWEKKEQNRKLKLVNLAKGATTVYNTIQNLDDFIRTFPNYFIINLGVVDASNREIPLWFYRLASSKKDNLIVKLSSVFYREVIIKFRPLLVRLRLKSAWVSKKKFQKYYRILIRELLKETNAKIIVIPINVGSDRIEKQLPGTQKRHKEYNETIREIAMEFGQDAIEINDLSSKDHYPDGVHYSVLGHEIIANKIFNKICAKLEG